MKTIKEFKIKIGTISKGFKEETYLLKEDMIKLIDELLVWADGERVNNNIYRKSVFDLNENFQDKLEELKKRITG